MVEARTEGELAELVRSAYEPLLVLAGGSNVVVADGGFPGTVVRVLTRGVRARRRAAGGAGGRAVGRARRATASTQGLQGFECLSGIPGSTGATPIQNVGAYGQEVAETVESVRVLDRASGADLRAAGGRRAASATARASSSTATATSCSRSPSGCASRPCPARCATRSSRGRSDVPGRRQRAAGGGPRGRARAAPRQGHGDRPRRPRLGQRRLVLHEPDPRARRLRAPAGARRADAGSPPAFPEPDGRIKTSAAWLIERAGFPRGYGDGRVGISTKHTLALVNRGGATHRGADGARARDRRRRAERFGVALAPEPVLVGHDW